MSHIYLKGNSFRQIKLFQIKSNVLLQKSFLKVLKKLNIHNLIEIGASNAEISQIFTKSDKNIAWAIEANPYTYNEKTKRHKSKNLHTFNFAIGNQSGETEIYIPFNTEEKQNLTPGNASLLKPLFERNFLKVKIEIETLDQFIKDERILKSIGLWVDVEGASINVIVGGKKELNKELIEVIFIEVEHRNFWEMGTSFNNLDSTLKELDFCVLAKDYEYLNQNNVIYIKRNKRYKVLSIKLYYEMLIFFNFLRSFRIQKVVKTFLL